MDLLDIIVLIIISAFAISDNWMRNKSHARDKESWFELQRMMRDSLVAYCELVNEEYKNLHLQLEHQSIRIEMLEERLGKRIKIT